VLGQESSRAFPGQGALATVDLAARRLGSLLAAWLPAVLLAGCASVADVTGTATQSDLLQLRGEVAAAQQAAQRAKVDAETAAVRAVEARLKTQSTDGERDVTGLNRRLDGLATSLTELTARIDELSARVDALGRQVRGGAAGTASSTGTASGTGAATSTGTTSSGGSVSSSGTAGSSAPSSGTSGVSGPSTATATPTARPAPAPSGAAPPPPAGSRPTSGTLQPQDIYQAAYIDFSKGSYALAMAGFREFLRRFPDHALAGNAQYWIGEGHFSQARAAANAGQNDRVAQELEQAVQEYRKVLANYPRSEKAPTSLYKEALALIELKQPGVAQQRLEYLVANFPQAEETPMARERLAALKTPR
jgi:tol-pal system protein YbgF